MLPQASAIAAEMAQNEMSIRGFKPYLMKVYDLEGNDLSPGDENKHLFSMLHRKNSRMPL